jgi:glycosyltransferase involved in cell wall biosynthesis
MRKQHLKINFFVQFVYKQGTYFRFHNLAIGLQKLGHTVTIWGCDYLRSWGGIIEENREGVKYVIAPGNKLQSLFGQTSHPFTAYKRSSIEYLQADINHLFQPFLSAAWPWMRNKNNARLNVYDWDDFFLDGEVWANPKLMADRWCKISVRYLERNLPSKADLVTVCSDFLKQKAMQRAAEHVEIIYNGYWPARIPDKQTSRKALNLSAQAKYYGFMGRTHAEIDWCYNGMRKILRQNESVRLAICGSGAYILDNIESELKDRIDYLGMLSPENADLFANAIDIGLLPLEDDLFNRSRLPIKLANYQAMGTISLFSDIGETGVIAKKLPWNINGGKTKDSWLAAFENSVPVLLKDELPGIDFQLLEEQISWQKISEKLESVYFKHLNLKFPTLYSNNN